jgi:hypothetical protein
MKTMKNSNHFASYNFNNSQPLVVVVDDDLTANAWIEGATGDIEVILQGTEEALKTFTAKQSTTADYNADITVSNGLFQMVTERR